MERIRKADGDALRLFREEHWLTQRQLADRAGVSRATVVEIESGRNKDPQNATLQKLAGALEIDPSELIDHSVSNGFGRPLDRDETPDSRAFGTG